MAKPTPPPPPDAEDRRAIPPVICYPPETLPPAQGLGRATPITTPERHIASPRDAVAFRARAGQTIRITCPEGSQVGDLNLWNANDLSERFFSGKTRALHGTHVSTGDRLWSCLPHLRPLATVTYDSLAWYGIDEFGGSVHDVIGTRCDPYTHTLLSGGGPYHHCCHSNLTRALSAATGLPLATAELHIHDVLNVFMCTGFTRDTGQYFMKASPARPGDALELRAEIDLLGALSACPGGNCASSHSSDAAQCHPLHVEIFDTATTAAHTAPAPNPYDRTHGTGA